MAGGVMRTCVYVFDCPDLTRGPPSSGTEGVDVGAREDSRTGQGVANDVVPNLVVVQDVAFREHGVPERVDVSLGDIVVEANSIAVDVAEEYCTAPDLLHGDLDSIHEQVAGRDPVEVIDRKSTRLNSSHVRISYAVFCLKKKKKKKYDNTTSLRL